MAILAPTPSNVERAARRLAAGELVAFPTETVYGLGADATNAAACARIFAVKGRPAFDPLIVHLAALDWLPRVAARVPAAAARLGARFWPGPLTLVLPKAHAIPGIVTAGLDTVAVRIPNHPVALALLRALGRPLAAPSANRFGGLSPTRAEHVARTFGDELATVLDGGPCAVGVESTIVDTSREPPSLLRPGGLARETLEAALGMTLLQAPAVLERPLAPGQLASHYAPRTPLCFADGAPPPGRTGLLAFRAPANVAGYAAVEVLSPAGDLTEAAARLFEALHRLDAAGLDAIVAEAVPETGLGLAIMDRLRKAAAGAR
jgi:L-threonylcarbamoyladenylate synthase